MKVNKGPINVPTTGTKGWGYNFFGKNDRYIGSLIFEKLEDYNSLQEMLLKHEENGYIKAIKDYDEHMENGNYYKKWYEKNVKIKFENIKITNVEGSEIKNE